MTRILGISAFDHDSAAVLVVDGEIVAAAPEERFTHRNHDPEFPTRAVEHCLREAGIEPQSLDFVGFYDKPLLKFDRLLETYLAGAPAGVRSFTRAMPVWLRRKLDTRGELDRGLRNRYRKRYIFTEHQESHAASAFFPSPFEEAAILTLDGVGEWATASYGTGRGNRIHLTRELRFPHSLGLLRAAFASFCGLGVHSGGDELKSLAPTGDPKHADWILEHLIDLKPDGSFRMDQSYFNYCHGLTMTSSKLDRALGGPPRRPGTPVTQREKDLAASIQKVTEEIVMRCVTHVHRETGMRHLCLAGGIARWSADDERLRREGPFENVWIQPAAGDAGGALGVALFIWYQLLNQSRIPEPAEPSRGPSLTPPSRAATTEPGPARRSVLFRIWLLLSRLILGGLFYAVFTPVGLILRLFGYDPLKRRFDRAAASYWVAHDPFRPGCYFNQY